MNGLLSVLYGVTTAVLGAACGLWLGRQKVCSGSVGGFTGGDDMRWAREVLSRLSKLTEDMATSVGEHHALVRTISEGLRSKACGPRTVAAAVAELMRANIRLERDLSVARERLREQALQIEAHAVEARVDALTRLANRRAFEDEVARRFDEYQRHRRPLSLLLIDIDHFRDFNTAHGRRAGDEILRGMGYVLRRKIRTMDLAARYGGDQFAIVMPGTVGQDAAGAAERIRRGIAETSFGCESPRHRITVSVGVAELRPCENPNQLVRRAEEALRSAKAAGRDSVWHHTGDGCLPFPGDRKARHWDPATSGGRCGAVPAPIEPAGVDVPSPAPPRSEASPLGENQEREGREPATPLLDRPAFCQQVRCRLAEWRRGGAGFSLLFTELDDFRWFCDKYRNDAGDSAIRRFADLVRSRVREMDLVARYSPTCFAVLMPKTQLTGAVAVARRLHHELAWCYWPISDQRFRFTASVGLASIAEGDDAVRLLERTQEALESARASGGNTTHAHNGHRPEPVGQMVVA